ncbi:hypothetical protein [Methylobacter sp.]|uniref:hypothetical protein n=1 Tax=Methylobacter sp. TaxID=2051955 RepID=UPI0012200D7E|nr:hypothetical protein [Methylobacter sp.]TAK59481.1 MAG: hypothetical protein EPO18_20170 [Methylobacter sp.]
MSAEHIKRVAKERYNLVITTPEIGWILAKIGRGGAELIKEQSYINGQHWELEFKGKKIVAVTERDAKGIYTLKTLYPKGWGKGAFTMGQAMGVEEP